MSSAALLPLRKATALYNYTPDEEDELELHEGDVVCVTKEQDDGWCRGFVESDPIKHLGLFPSNYVRNVTPPPPSTISALPPSHLPPYRPVVTVKAPIARRAKASFDYLPRGEYSCRFYYHDGARTFVEPDELTLRMGDVVVVLETLDDGWCRGYIASDSSHHEGLFPANYVDMQEDSWTTTSHLGNTASKSPTKPAPSKAYPALDNTTPLDDNESDDDDPHWRHKGKSINLTHGGSRALHPSAVEATEPRASLESMQEPADLKEQPLPEGESGYYDDRGNYVMADGGYYSPDGLYFPKILDPTTTPAGYYDADGYYITDSGYFDLQGHYHDNTTEATTTKPSKVNAAKTSIGSVVQLKQALKRAKANADAAQAARLEAETQMQMELEARRRSERAAAARVERERAHEAQTKVIQQTIQNQIQKQLAKSTPPPFAHQQHEVQPVEHIQRWYRSQTSRTHLRQVMAAVARKQPRPRHLPPKNTKATVPPPMRPPRLNSPASALHPSSSLLPIFTTDVAQISQLATLIANSVNVELSKRMRAHDLQLDRLVTSVTHLQKAIDKHNGSLERVFSNQDRPPPQDVKAVLGNAKLPSLLPKATYSNYVSNVVVAPPTTSTGLYYNSSPTKQLRSIKQLPSKLPQQTSSRASKLPVLRSPTKARTKWPSRKLK
ncbi:hypothetical protein DYB25_003940 [Aphanomyces astaci]|uniref:SH3 domain-containing protein n=1 Tax=Aphanomyces astaci TaxID=112090 RepID=A0A397AZH3_APHAT|nr:hypothetical protein DYB25_003940 [Aphanomyces astaci]